jgi:hypothetical protein
MALKLCKLQSARPNWKREIQKQIQSTAASSAKEVLLRLLATQEEQDRWLFESREAIQSRIKLGLDQLQRGEAIPEDQLSSHLAKLSQA